MKYTDKALLRKLVQNEGVFLRFDVDVLSFFSLQFFVVASHHAWCFQGESELCCLKFHDAFFCCWVNDKTCLNVKSSRVLEKGTFEYGNVGFKLN